jgi:hypothetical protein
MAALAMAEERELPAASRVLGSEGISATANGLRIDTRLPWYRSLPVSTIEVGEVRINGEIIDPSKITFELEKKRFALSELANQTSLVWYVLDSAYLDVAGSGWKVGDELAVSVTLILYPPYIPGLKRMTVQSKALQLRAEAGSGGAR